MPDMCSRVPTLAGGRGQVAGVSAVHGMGFHSSTSQLNLSRDLSLNSFDISHKKCLHKAKKWTSVSPCSTPSAEEQAEDDAAVAAAAEAAAAVGGVDGGGGGGDTGFASGYKAL